MEVGIYIKCRSKENPRGAGEAAAVIEYVDRAGKSHIRGQHIQEGDGTKNSLSLKISIAAMRILLKPCHITIHTDCDYMANACKLGWLRQWWKDGWKKANGKPPANVEEWKQFRMLAMIHTVEFAPYDSKFDGQLREMMEGWHENKKHRGRE